MRKLIGTICIGILVIVGIGLARGWLSFSTEADESNANFGVSIDKSQLKEDTDKLKEGVKGVSEQFRSSDDPGTSSPETTSESPDQPSGSSGLILPPVQ